MINETRVKESLNLVFHGLRTSQRSAMLREVREWLDEMDPAVFAFGVEECHMVYGTHGATFKCNLQAGHEGEHRSAGSRFDISLSDFNPDRMLDRMRAECELREMSQEYPDDGSNDIG